MNLPLKAIKNELSESRELKARKTRGLQTKPLKLNSDDWQFRDEKRLRLSRVTGSEIPHKPHLFKIHANATEKSFQMESNSEFIGTSKEVFHRT